MPNEIAVRWERRLKSAARGGREILRWGWG
jgi:hypothetical protein